MQGRIVEGVGFAHRPGRNTIKADLRRLLMRVFVWLLFRRQIALGLRQSALFGALRAGSWLPRLFAVSGASKGNTFENDILKLIFNATAIANIADNAASSPLTDLRIGLHTADPGEAGDQTTSEVAISAYGQYVRKLVARTTGGWTVTNNSVSPVAAIDFDQMSSGTGATFTHFGIGTASSGAGKLLYSGTLTPNIVVSNGVIPRIGVTSTITED